MKRTNDNIIADSPGGINEEIFTCGRIVEATIRAIVEHTDGLRLQVDFGKDETALIREWQIIKKTRN